jgi:DNA-binding transcriptional MerR regulator
MGTDYNLTVEQVARIAGCHRNTVLRYEKEGYLTPMRDNNGFRRFSKRDALKLKQLLEIRRPLEAVN